MKLHITPIDGSIYQAIDKYNSVIRSEVKTFSSKSESININRMHACHIADKVDFVVY